MPVADYTFEDFEVFCAQTKPDGGVQVLEDVGPLVDEEELRIFCRAQTGQISLELPVDTGIRDQLERLFLRFAASEMLSAKNVHEERQRISYAVGSLLGLNPGL